MPEEVPNYVNDKQRDIAAGVEKAAAYYDGEGNHTVPLADIPWGGVRIENQPEVVRDRLLEEGHDIGARVVGINVVGSTVELNLDS